MFALLYEKIISFLIVSLLYCYAGVAGECHGLRQYYTADRRARDSLPPFLVTAFTKDSTLNFNEKKIVLTFNEYVQR